MDISKKERKQQILFFEMATKVIQDNEKVGGILRECITRSAVIQK